MARYDESQLGQEAASLVPPGDPAFVSTTAIPFLHARQNRTRDWLGLRPDRFSQLLAAGSVSEIRGDRLHQQGKLTAEEHEELLELRPLAAERFREELDALLADLRRLLEIHDPLSTLAYLSHRHTFLPAGSYYEPAHEGSEVAVEVAAGLCLTQPRPTASSVPTPDVLSEIDSRLEELRRVSTLYTVASHDPMAEDSQVQVHAKSHWMTIRGEAYESHARDLAIAVFRPISDWMRDTHGFTIDEFLEVADGVLDLVVHRVNDAMRAAADRWNEMPTSHANEEAFRRVVEATWASLGRALIVEDEDFEELCSLPATLSRTVVEALSTELGALDRREYEGPFDPSPLSRRPFVSDGGRFLLPVPGHLVRAPHRLFDSDLQRNHAGYARRRAQAVDDFAVDLLREGLTGCTGETNLYYRFDDGEGEERYETDGLVLFEDYCLIVEGKGQPLSVAALRGDMVRLSRDLREHLTKAWLQCARVQRYLNSCENATFTDERGRTKLTVPASNSVSTLAINPMLYALGTYAYELPSLARLGMFPEDAQPWPVLITDLRVITEMVRSPAELLHYLEWRSGLSLGERVFAMDELDLFGAYLFGHVGREEVGEDQVLTMGPATADFDAYYAGVEGDGPPRERPRRVLGELLEPEIERLATDRPRRWLERSFAILDLSVVEAAALTARINVLSGSIPSTRWTVECLDGAMLVVLGADCRLSDVLLQLPAPPTGVTRRYVAQANAESPRLVTADRLGR